MAQLRSWWLAAEVVERSHNNFGVVYHLAIDDCLRSFAQIGVAIRQPVQHGESRGFYVKHQQIPIPNHFLRNSNLWSHIAWPAQGELY